MATKTSCSQIKALDISEAERIIKMEKPQNVMKTRNKAKGLLAMCFLPLTIRITTKASQKTTSIIGMIKYMTSIAP